ncbi:hypothetical protein AC519_3152 [Pseudomonas savastanoi]|nr:hypothetical protein AC519_3152 [Pseudomonas savastanoi]
MGVIGEDVFSQLQLRDSVVAVSRNELVQHHAKAIFHED